MTIKYNHDWCMHPTDKIKTPHPTLVKNNFAHTERKITFYCCSAEVYKELLGQLNDDKTGEYSYFDLSPTGLRV